ncbi:putative ABC transporter, multidrug efflux family [uncultured Candidatus Thioglobus sp.]|nr:putative ABC transporter, multidrug efflux family [uncultured Candidatus Thioglobus sp.]SMM99482.1 putative ABC transporter, multidrug efflux family [uncultured Candidatus Thioglobus sp.]
MDLISQQQFNTSPVEMADRYFLHLGDLNQSFIVTAGTVHLFYWSFVQGLPTSNKYYINSFHQGDILLGGNDYQQQDRHCGFYVILDHDATLSQFSTTDLLEHTDERVIDKLDNYLHKVSGLFTREKNNKTDFLAKSGDEQSYPEACQLVADEQSRIMWIKPEQSAGSLAEINPLDADNFSLLSQSIFVTLEKEQVFNCQTTADLSKNNELLSAITFFDNWIKSIAAQYIEQRDGKREDNFFYLQAMQSKHLNNAYNQLFDSYYGKEDVTPDAVVIDESLPAHRLINQVCELLDMPPLANGYRVIEKLDINNKAGIEEALNVYRIYSREVLLPQNWHKKDHWTLISSFKDSGKTVILNYQKGQYHCYDIENDYWFKIDETNIDSIDVNALILYRPLPEQPVKSGFDLLKKSLFFAKKDLKVIILTGILIGILHLIVPIVSGHLIAEALPSNDIGLIYGYLIAMLSVAFGIALFQFVNSISLSRLEIKSALDLHASVWSRLLQLPMSFFAKYSVGDLSERANMVESIHSIWSSAATSAILSLFSISVTFALLFYYSVGLAAIAMLIFVLILLIVWWFVRSVEPVLKGLYRHKGEINNIVFQTLNGINKFRIASKENTILSLWSSTYNKTVVKNRKYMINNAIMQSLFQLLPLFASIVIYSFVYYSLYNSDANFSLADFISFNAAFGQAIGALIGISSILSSVILTKPMMERIMPILTEKIEIDNSKITIDTLKGDIKISNLFFKYADNLPMVLKDLSISIKQGEYVAIVGSSGSGKSTIFRLLMGFEQAQSGSISIDDMNINDIKISSLRKKIGVVLQDGAIIPGSIKENISAGNNSITEEQIWHALKLAGMEDDVRRMPMNIHTIISENGSSVSGGQLQRLIISRALVDNPSMLLLDEATSAMDNIVQRLVQDTLDKMNITRVVIAHRLSTVKNADCIYVLDKGKIVESGNYDQLMDLDGHFCQLVKRQQ